ncbi:MAG: UDP-N-acetylmuramate--L-alanine ligase [Trueperaceae bacterium]|nr:MAG: UDP-N-acetylmuramate--L-alanine ligase [Trueperaceae bacterium]
MKPHLHFMGIGGIGMSGLARWYALDGYRISGCDAVDTPLLMELRQAGLQVHVGHNPDHLEDASVFVSSMAVPDHHPEILTARSRGLRMMKRIELLADLCRKRKAVAVTGTHGKSTTTGMIASIFLGLGQDPSVQLGANLPLLPGNYRYGGGEHVIAEVDESDPGFAQLESELAIITNLEDDHIAGNFEERRNYHASFADLQRATREFSQRTKQLLICADWRELGTLLGDLGNTLSYGFDPSSDYYIDKLELAETGCRFELRTPNGSRHPIRLAIPGRHNAQNATAALAAADLAGLPLEAAARQLGRFSGVGRRWQVWSSKAGTLIIDDYAHHPTEVAATLTAAHDTGRRVRAVLQPHRWIRTALHWEALADAASLADEVLVLDIYSAGEEAIAGIGPDLIAHRLQKGGTSASCHDLASASDYLLRTLVEGDLVITLGAGDVWKVAESITRHLEERHAG